MDDNNEKYYKTELMQALFGDSSKIVCVPENVLENVAGADFIDPFKEDIEQYKEKIMQTLMDILAEEIKRLTLKQQEIINHYFFMERHIRHIAQDLGVNIPTLVERRDGALKKLRRRLTHNPVFMQLYRVYCDEDLPPTFFKNK